MARLLPLVTRLELPIFFALIFAASPALAAVTVNSVLRGTDTDNNISWVSVSLSNPMSRPLEGTLEFSTYGYRAGQNETTLEVAPIPPGASRHLNIAVPLGDVQRGVLRERNGDVTDLNIYTGYRSESRQKYLFVAEQSQRPTDEEMDNFTYRMLPAEPSIYTGSPGSGATTRTLSAGERVVTHITPENLPENWLCYLPLQFVIMPENVERRLTAPQRLALDTWISLGGRLILFGGSAETKPESVMHGETVRTDRNPLQDESAKLPDGHAPLGPKILVTHMPYAEKTAGGRGGAFLLATLFLIVVGPVNYLYFQRRGEIRKLIVTVPLISVTFCSLIAGYFVITQGFNRKGGSISVAMVDEQTNRAMTFARHSLLTGLYPLGGFRFGPETHFLPKVGEHRDASSFDLTRERVLTKGLFQPGIPFNYVTLTPHTTRERLMFDEAKNTVRNGYELPVKRVVVYRDGGYFTGGAVAPGASVAVTAVDKADLPWGNPEDTDYQVRMLRIMQLLGQQSLESEELNAVQQMARDAVAPMAITTATLYAAIFDGIPKSSEAGVEISDGRNLHILVGKTSAGEAQP